MMSEVHVMETWVCVADMKEAWCEMICTCQTVGERKRHPGRGQGAYSQIRIHT